jgi:hypothetical protein
MHVDPCRPRTPFSLVALTKRLNVFLGRLFVFPFFKVELDFRNDDERDDSILAASLSAASA